MKSYPFNQLENYNIIKFIKNIFFLIDREF